MSVDKRVRSFGTSSVASTECLSDDPAEGSVSTGAVGLWGEGGAGAAAGAGGGGHRVGSTQGFRKSFVPGWEPSAALPPTVLAAASALLGNVKGVATSGMTAVLPPDEELQYW